MSGPFYLAWVDPEETTFGPEHEVEDEQVVSAEINEEEGEIAGLDLVIQNPRIGPHAPGRKTWAWLSWETGDSLGVVPLFFGELVAVPSNMLDEKVTFQFRAAPLDFQEQKIMRANAKRVLPYYDPIFTDISRRDDPDEVLNGYPERWHVHRVTHAVTTTNITTGEDGTLVFTVNDVPYKSLDYRLNEAPLLQVGVDVSVSWRQRTTGTVDLGSRTFASYSGDGIVADWPQVGSTLEGGWGVVSSLAADVNGISSALTASWSFQWQNKAKRHNNGDHMSLSVSVSEPQLTANKIRGLLTQNIQPGIINPFATDEEGNPAPINIPMSIQETYMDVPLWQVNASMVLRYDPDRERTERVMFVVGADLQPVITAPEQSDRSELLTMQGVDVGSPILRLRTWEPNTAVSLGDIMFPEYYGFPGLRIGQIVIQAGTTGAEEPDFSPVFGDEVDDGTARWSSLGSVSPDTAPQDWVESDDVQAGTLIVPRVGLVIEYTELVRPGMVQQPQVGVAVNEGQIIRGSNGSYHVCKLSGTTNSPVSGFGFTFPVGYTGIFSLPIFAEPEEPDWPTAWGAETTDGSVTWFCLGTQLPSGSDYHIAINDGTTGEFMPPFSSTEGGSTADGSVTWINVGLGEIPVGGSAGKTPRAWFWPTDRGRQALEHWLCRARAKLLYHARAVQVSFECGYERAIELTCRKNALIFDPRLPGGQAFGKIIKYKISASGNGVLRGYVTIGCTIGKANSVVINAGAPVYAAPGYMQPGYQQFTAQIVPVAGDIAYSPPVASNTDDGLVFPLTREQAVHSERFHGSLQDQVTAINDALAAAQAAANLGQVQPENPQTSILVQQLIAALNQRSVDNALKRNPIWYEIVLKPLGGSFDHLYSIKTSPLVAPKHVDLAAPAISP